MSSINAPTGFAILVSALCVIGLVVTWWLALRRPSIARPCCGACGYSVSGLDALACPECGNDLREVGIDTPAQRMMQPWLFVVLWTALLIVPAMTAYTVAMRLGPRSIVADATFGIRATSGSLPLLRIDERIDAVSLGAEFGVVGDTSMRVTGPDGNVISTLHFPRVSSARVRKVTVGVSAVSEADGTPGRTLRIAGGPNTNATVDREALSAMIAEARAGPPGEEAEADETAAAALLQALVDGEPEFATTRLRTGGSTSISSFAKMPGWYPALVITCGFAVYALGILLYRAMRKRRLAHVAAIMEKS